MSTWFWFLAGVLTGAGATAVVIRFWRRSGSQSEVAERRPMRYAMAAGCIALFAVSAITIYLAVGSPTCSGTRPREPAHPSAAQPMSGGKALSIEAATAGLEARLAAMAAPQAIGSCSLNPTNSWAAPRMPREHVPGRRMPHLLESLALRPSEWTPPRWPRCCPPRPVSSMRRDRVLSATGSASSAVSPQDAHELETKVRKEPATPGRGFATGKSAPHSTRLFKSACRLYEGNRAERHGCAGVG